MSSELERRLREAREILPDPDGDATGRGRGAALAAITLSKRPRVRSRLVVALALLVATALGVGIGALMVPSGTAAREPAGIGFLPAEGWFVTQNATQATEEHPAHAIASNVPLQPGDGGSIVPYSTLLGLPDDGIVVVANFIRSEFLPGLTYGPKSTMGYPEDRLPLRIDDAVELDEFGSLVRPEQPLGQYKLQAEVEGYSVEVDMYFGSQEPSRALLEEAQGQLEQLIVAPERAKKQRGTAQPSESVTMKLVLRRFDSGCQCYKTHFSGTISSGAAGEYVAVMKQGCGYSYGTAVVGAETREGGFWEAEVTGGGPNESADFRARWKTNLSAPVSLRGKVIALPIKIRGTRRYKVFVNAVGTRQRLEGRFVMLQRLRGSTWSTVQRARLKRDALGGGYSAVFTVSRRGWTLRGFVPAKTLAPCFTATATEKFVS